MCRFCGGRFFADCPKCGSQATRTHNMSELFRHYQEFICHSCGYHWDTNKNN